MSEDSLSRMIGANEETREENKRGGVRERSAYRNLESKLQALKFSHNLESK